MEHGVKITDSDHQRLAAYIKSNFGVNLEKKKSLIEGRLGLMIQRRGFQDFGAYIDFALSEPSGGEIAMLIARLTTNYTYFMREEQHFSFLTREVLPVLCPTIADKDLRIWSAACSSGEEPYTIAMTLADYFGGIHSPWDKTVLATDISDNVLKVARQGIYSRESLARVPSGWVSSYFRPLDNDMMQVVDDMRKQIAFASFNLMSQTFPFRKKFHAIFCRNVMIYFDTPTKDALIRRFYQQLVPGGYLFIGMSETLSGKGDPFRQIRPSIYRKDPV